jgi:hypothetical protein
MGANESEAAMNIRVRKYSEWKDTAIIVHIITQMMGKVKLSRMESQPEWAHVLLNLTSDGFTTGLIPYGDKSFSIEYNIRESKLVTVGIDGRESGFSLGGDAPISEYFKEFKRMLTDVMCETEIYTMPQEMSVKTHFHEDNERRVYDPDAARDFVRSSVFAYEGISKFVSGYRGKKLMPQYFWGTFDTTGVLFSGKESPWPGEGIIEAGAFDEQMMEFGFWPGDEAFDDPAFYVLTYPFPQKDYTDAGIRPDKAWFSTEKSEFFFKLSDALAYDDPQDALGEFLKSGYEIFTRGEGWANSEWHEKPLLYTKGSCKLQG